MPIYEYRCQACGEQFDKFIRSLTQLPAEVICPACHSADTRRVMSMPAVHMGGAGAAHSAPAEPSPATPPVFGRKELQQAEARKSELREQAKQEAKDAAKK
jgi:putative FmdB family regulatory protein